MGRGAASKSSGIYIEGADHMLTFIRFSEFPSITRCDPGSLTTTNKNAREDNATSMTCRKNPAMSEERKVRCEKNQMTPS